MISPPTSVCMLTCQEHRCLMTGPTRIRMREKKAVLLRRRVRPVTAKANETTSMPSCFRPSSFSQLQENMWILSSVLSVEMSLVVALADATTVIPHDTDIDATTAQSLCVDPSPGPNQEIQASVKPSAHPTRMMYHRNHMAANSLCGNRRTTIRSVFTDITEDSQLRETGLRARSV